MAYCTVAQVLSMFPEISAFETDTTSGITDAEVTATWIPEIDGEIDDLLRNIYVVPITDATDLPTLRSISKALTASRLHEVIYSTDVDASSDPSKPTKEATPYGRRAMATLLQIVSDKRQLATTRITHVAGGVYDSYDDLTSDEREAENVPRVKLAEEW